MTEEMKLITALCESLGFKVEVEHDYDERKEPKRNISRYQSMMAHTHSDGRELKHICGTYVIDKNGEYTTKLIKPITTYKLTKKEQPKGDV